ncbi:glycosyltransferase family 2 protein [Cryobacterium sp. 1639]|uniref:glycosyltransferase family 2 protein n=1 Tax=Cryobacterium inferilacus TaxID=2866629 RepID=UPI001C73B01B|nr:glycosyltransferase family 2 protein [Cryobacterium sp. 1639]MBX0301946.1 glycosyltransferase family 2 protein [Cryobacterium sp. 1639]
MIQILMPMGGLGQRFKAVGIDTPKPLIEVDGKPMFRKALSSFDGLQAPKTLTVIVREDDDADSRLSSQILASEPSATIVHLKSNTRGAAETALLARDVLDADQPLVILDCDIAFTSDDYLATIATDAGDDGVLLSFHSTDPRYSYVEADELGHAVRTAEKDPISNNALAGSYFFRRASVFFDAAERLLERPISPAMPEYYMSLVFNELLAAGAHVGVANGDFYCFGTPQELADYQETGLPIGSGTADE